MAEKEEEQLELEQTDAVDPIEEHARNTGWVSKDEWIEQGKDPKQWVPADIFNMRGEFFNEIHSLKRQVRQYGQVIDDLKQHNAKLAKQKSDELVKGLRQEKAKAIEEGDGKKVAAIDDWIDEIREKDAQPPEKQNKVADPQEIAPFIQEWINGNPWYTSDNELKNEADSIAYGEAMIKANAKGSPLDEYEVKQILENTTRKVKRLYPEKFTNPNKSKPSAVAGSETTKEPKGKSSKVKLSDIPEDYRDVAKRLTSDPDTGLTLDEYHKQLKMIGAI